MWCTLDTQFIVGIAAPQVLLGQRKIEPESFGMSAPPASAWRSLSMWIRRQKPPLRNRKCVAPTNQAERNRFPDPAQHFYQSIQQPDRVHAKHVRQYAPRAVTSTPFVPRASAERSCGRRPSRPDGLSSRLHLLQVQANGVRDGRLSTCLGARFILQTPPGADGRRPTPSSALGLPSIPTCMV